MIVSASSQLLFVTRAGLGGQVLEGRARAARWVAAASMSAIAQVRRCPAWVHQNRAPSVQTVRPAVTEMTANFCAAAVMMPVRPT